MPDTPGAGARRHPANAPSAPAATPPPPRLHRAPQVVEPMGNERPPRWAWLDAKEAPFRGFRGSAKGKEPQGDRQTGLSPAAICGRLSSGPPEAPDAVGTPPQRHQEQPAGGNREDLRQGTASALRLVAAGDRPGFHADRRRPLRGRGSAADPRRGHGAVALGVLVQPGPAAQVPARLGTGTGRRTARGRAAGPGERSPRLVERRHRRHRPAGLAAGPPRLAGVRPQGSRRRFTDR